jgi:formate hydrogenlyase subunit 3/multisubunit Na+/H+ antiporter MnhD subunit
LASAVERVSSWFATRSNPCADADATVLSHAALTGFSLAVALLFGMGASGGFVPPRAGRRVLIAVTGVVLALALSCLFAAPAPASLALVSAPPLVLRLGLDPLSLPFVALLAAVGLAVAVALPPARPSSRAALLLGALLLALLAADLPSLGAALLVALPASGSGLPGGRRARILLGLWVLAVLALAVSLGVSAGGSFAALRVAPPPAGRAAVLLALAVLVAAPLLRFFGSRPLPAVVAAGDETAALAVVATTGVGCYLLLRLLFDLGGPAPPLWWGATLLALGAAGALTGSLRALLAADLRAVAVHAMVAAAGFITLGLGLALAAKGADLPDLAALSLAAALTLLLALALAVTGLLLVAAVVGRAAGSCRLERLGGQLRLLPATGVGALAAVASLAFLPPSGGFAGQWLLLQALLGGLRFGGPLLALPLVLALMATALASAALVVAALRAFGIAFLGRPRTPRAAAAEETERPARSVLLALAAASALPALLPGPLLGLLAPLFMVAVGASMGGRAAFWLLAAREEGGGYRALAITFLLALALGLVAWALRRGTVPGHRVGPLWESAATPPPWLPFGDPACEYGPESFSEALSGAFGGESGRFRRARRWLRAWLADDGGIL